MNLISVIVTTYNWPAALELSLDSLFAQQDKEFEIIIADDGSTIANQEQVLAYCASSPVPVRYIYS
jgi:glycosyltransferase involved in cell wall biosynthesis